MRYIKLFKESEEYSIKNYFHNITDTQNVIYEEKIIPPIMQIELFQRDVYLTYPEINSFDKEDLEESMGHLEDDGFKVSENRIYFFFNDIDRVPMRSFDINKIPSKYDLHSLHQEAFDKNGETHYPEDYEEGSLSVRMTIYK